MSPNSENQNSVGSEDGNSASDNESRDSAVEKAYTEEFDSYAEYVDSKEWEDHPGKQVLKVQKKAIEIAQKMMKEMEDGPKAAAVKGAAKAVAIDMLANALNSVTTAPLVASIKSGIEAKTNNGHTLAMNDRGVDIKLSTVMGHSLSMIDVPISKAADLPGEFLKKKLKKQTFDRKALTESLATGIFIGTWWGHSLNLNDLEQKCEIISKKAHAFKIFDLTETIEITLDKGHKIILSGKDKSILIESKDGRSIEINDKREQILIRGKGSKNYVRMDDKKKRITVSSVEGDIELNAPKGNINIMGKNVRIIAKENLSMKGKQVLSTAGNEHTTKGNMVKSEAQAINTVKGGMVQLNP